MQDYSVMAKSDHLGINPTILTAVFSLAFTTATHAQKHSFVETQLSGQSATLFFLPW
jgi:hypothetical protein